MKGAKKFYLKCEVSEGIFSNEIIVKFKDVKGNNISGCWPSNCTKNGLLEVRVAETGKDKSLILGPFLDCGGYGFFPGKGFYVSNDLLSSE